MHINPYLFILARPPHHIVWNYSNHTQFELDFHYSKRLTQLITCPELFDPNSTVDQDFLATSIITDEEIPTPEWGWDDLSRIFHIGTKNLPQEHIPQDVHEWAVQYLAHCNEVLSTPAPEPNRIDPHNANLVALPVCKPADALKGSLATALINRKTSRSFTGQSLSLRQLSTLLYLSLGYLNERRGEINLSIPLGMEARRSSPSGGGLNACEGYVYVQHVTGLKAGVYAYSSDLHALSLISPLPDEPLGKLVCGQHFINTLPVGLFITSRFDKLWWKYEHSRAYRMAYVEAGHIAQTFQLVATQLGLDTWLTGALTDDRVEALLGLDDSPEQPLFFVGCGKGDGQVQCQELMALIQHKDPAP